SSTPYLTTSPRPTLFPYTTLFRSKGSNPAKLPSEYTPKEDIVYEYFIKGTEPTEVSSKYDKLTAPTNLDVMYDQVTNQHNIKIRSEEHTSELQSRENLVCRLLLEK